MAISSRCHQREVFLQLEEGIYRSTMTKVKLESELKSMLAIGALVDAVEEVEVDAAILRLLVQEVGTNANKFTAPGEPIQVKARVEEGERCNVGSSPSRTIIPFGVVLPSRGCRAQLGSSDAGEPQCVRYAAHRPS